MIIKLFVNINNLQTSLFLMRSFLTYSAELSKYYAHRLNYQPPENAGSIQKSKDLKIFIGMVVGSEQNQKSDSRSDKKPCHHLTGIQDPHEIKLCDCNRSRTVWNQSHHTCKKYAYYRLTGQEAADRIFADAFHQYRDDKGKDEDKDRNLQCVPEC